MMPPDDHAPVGDPGNVLLQPVMAKLYTAVVDGPDGTQRMALTIRTASTTLTVFLSAADAVIWGNRISGEASNLSEAGLIVPRPVPPRGLLGRNGDTPGSLPAGPPTGPPSDPTVFGGQ